ncbi:MAG: glycosyltransferase family 2 protein [Planctomycetota bacterium]|jgi:glycosyltransferase involved in cell wall biosynthesis
MPVHNGEDFLEQSLRSILNQDFKDFELVISDNASTDATGEICRQYARQDRRIRYHRFDRNVGGAENFNQVFRFSSGAYFKWAADDDVHAPGYLQACIEAFDSAPPEIVLVYPKTVLIDGEGAELRNYDDRMDVRFTRPSRRLCHVVQHLDMCNAVFGVIRSSALRRTRLLGRYVSSDNVLLAELALLGQFWEVPERLFYRRVHPGMSRAANPTPRQLAAWFDPNHAGSYVMPMSRLFLEHVRAIRRARLAPAEKCRCYAVVFREWLGRSKAIAREATGVLAQVLVRNVRP